MEHTKIVLWQVAQIAMACRLVLSWMSVYGIALLTSITIPP